MESNSPSQATIARVLKWGLGALAGVTILYVLAIILLMYVWGGDASFLTGVMTRAAEAVVEATEAETKDDSG